MLLFINISGNMDDVHAIDLPPDVLPWEVQVPDGWTAHWESDVSSPQ